MRFNLKKTLAGAAAIAVVASVAPFLGTSVASAATPGSPGAGVAGVNPTSGTSSTPFQVVLPPGAACPGDSAGAGWRLQSFIVQASVDLNGSNFVFNANGSPTAVAGEIRQSLFNTFGSAFRNGSTDLAVPPAVVGQISGVPFFNFATNAPGTFPDGAYKIGIACTLGFPNTSVTYWSKTITIDYQPGTSATNGPGELTWVEGAAAAAPVLTAANAGDSQITAVFSPGTSDPAVLAGGFTAIATPVSGGSPGISATGSGSPIVIPGLANGTQYSVTVTANNGVGSPAVSNAISPVTPTLAPRPGPTGLSAIPGAPGEILLSWNAPAASPATLTGYEVVVPGATGSPFTVVAPTTTLSIPNLNPGTNYSWSVQALYAAPDSSNPVNGTPFTVNGDAFIYQDITVTRPADALILTQVCGRYGEMPAENWVPVPGLGNLLPAVAGGTIPDLEDPARFAEYPIPSPATYPTRCGVDMGTAKLVTTGGAAGAFFAAEGRLNQVTVVDTRAANPAGWTVNGKIDPTFVSGSATFPGSQLGWTPQVTSFSTTQNPVAGAPIFPGTAPGLLNDQPLFSAADGSDLGIATADARLKLLIPVSAQSGTYTATLTISVI